MWFLHFTLLECSFGYVLEICLHYLITFLFPLCSLHTHTNHSPPNSVLWWPTGRHDKLISINDENLYLWSLDVSKKTAQVRSSWHSICSLTLTHAPQKHTHLYVQAYKYILVQNHMLSLFKLPSFVTTN